MRTEPPSALERFLGPRRIAPSAARIPLDLRTLRDMLDVAVRQRRTLRWASYATGYSVLYGALRAGVELARLGDEMLYPGYRAVPVEQPTFIFANARSGTTLLHRLMSLDEERFASFKMYESILPSVGLHRVVERGGRLDEAAGGWLSRAVDWIDQSQFGRWEGIHATGLRAEEEDEVLFVYTLDGAGVLLLFPYVDELPHAYWLDRVQPEMRRRIMGFYENSIQRFLYQRGGYRTFLNKNVWLTGRLRSVCEQWPDARFIYLIRHPYEAIPSFLSMFCATWASHSPDIARSSPEVRAFAQLAVDYYRYALEVRAEVPPEQFLVIRYPELVADPRGTVERVYGHFGLEMSAAYRERLKDATSRARRYRSDHEYSLAEFGLSRGWIREQLGDLFGEFGFDP